MPTAPFPAKVGRYEIQRELGRGGMGQVLLAFDPMIQRKVAVKTVSRSKLDKADAEEAIARFRREAQAAGRLTHPSIIAVYEYGEEGDLAYIVMECAIGASLREYMQRRKSFVLPELMSLARQMFSALTYSHEQGVVHRDLKPSNILVLPGDVEPAQARVKLLDFGIARIDASTLTKTGIVLGTPGYMSPEQYLGDTADARSDIYSLAVILFELATGTRPFTGSFGELAQRVLSEQPAAITSRNSDLPSALDAVFSKALAPKPRDRFASMRDFRDALSEVARRDHPGPRAIVSEGDGDRIRLSTTLTGMMSPDAIADAPTISLHSGKPAGAPQAIVMGKAADEAPTIDAHSLPAHALLSRGLATIRAQAASATQAPHDERSRLLLLDDEERIVSALKAPFRLKYHVFTATDGDSALKLVSDYKPHVIVSDQRMPHMLGVDFLRASRDVSPQSVRILLTGYSDLTAIVGPINDGEVYRFVHKPWSNQELQRTISDAVEIALAMKDVDIPSEAPPLVIPSETNRAEEAIVVVDSTHGLFGTANELFGHAYPVFAADQMIDAIAILEDQETAVLVADLDSAGAQAGALFKLLKQTHPQILTLVVTSAADSAAVIDLINHAQVFRFTAKPVRPADFRQQLSAALAQYQVFKAKPRLVDRHKV
jgi:serine/threonine-protein kinase